MSVFKFLLVALVGVHIATACTTRSRRSSRSQSSNHPPIDSGSVDIPISFQFQKGPIPSASFSVGVESKMNQRLENGRYKQIHQTGGVEISGAAIPVLDGNGKINGFSADIDTRMEHNHRVVHLDRNPMDPTPAEFQPFTLKPGQTYQNVPSGVRRRPELYQNHQKNRKEEKKEIAGLKFEYFITIVCIALLLLFTMLALVIVIAAKKRREIRLQNPRSNTYTTPPTIIPKVSVIDQKPPSYEVNSSRRSSSSMSDSTVLKKY